MQTCEDILLNDGLSASQKAINAVAHQMRMARAARPVIPALVSKGLGTGPANPRGWGQAPQTSIKTGV